MKIDFHISKGEKENISVIAEEKLIVKRVF